MVKIVNFMSCVFYHNKKKIGGKRNKVLIHNTVTWMNPENVLLSGKKSNTINNSVYDSVHVKCLKQVTQRQKIN